MPSFARELEQTLHNALGEASRRRHEYATLEHLLIALVDDEHASKVMTACGVSRDELRSSVKQYLDNELGALVADRSTARCRSCAAARRTTRSTSATPASERLRSPKGSPARSSRVTSPTCSSQRSSMRSTWAPC